MTNHLCGLCEILLHYDANDLPRRHPKYRELMDQIRHEVESIVGAENVTQRKEKND